MTGTITPGAAKLFTLTFIVIILGLLAVIRIGANARAEMRRTEATARAELQRSEAAAREQLRRKQVEACWRGDIVRGYLLLRAREFVRTDQQAASRTTKLAPALFPILDCDTGHPLIRGEARHYLTVLRSGREPVVTAARVAGARPLSGASR
jgi:multidrug efflux pump subunit AcrA (membrane-fusion protein)